MRRTLPGTLFAADHGSELIAAEFETRGVTFARLMAS